MILYPELKGVFCTFEKIKKTQNTDGQGVF